MKYLIVATFLNSVGLLALLLRVIIHDLEHEMERKKK